MIALALARPACASYAAKRYIRMTYQAEPHDGPRRWLRRILSAGLVALGGIALLHCSTASDSDGGDGTAGGATNPPDEDGGVTDAQFYDDAPGDIGSSPSDAQIDGAIELGVPPRVFFVHASANLFPVRLCYAVDGVVQPRLPLPNDPDRPMPMTNFPGIAPGSAYEMTEVDDFLTAAEVTPIAVRADIWQVAVSVAGGDDTFDCTKLVCDDDDDICLGNDPNLIAPLQAMNLYELSAQPIELLVLSGCVGTGAEDPGSKERCGGNFDPVNGNLGTSLLNVFPNVDPTPGHLGLKIAHLSPSIASLIADSANGELRIEVGSLADPNGRRELSVNQSLMSVDEPMLGSYVELPDQLDGFGTNGFIATVQDGPSVVRASVALSFAQVQQVSDSTSLPIEFYESSTSFLVALLGDVTMPSAQQVPGGAINPEYDGRGLHFIAIPAKPRTATE